MPEKICIYYPNPWPKPAHFKRRWHGHPVFPALLELGAPMKCVVNWKIYLDEFALATQIITDQLPAVERLSVTELESGFVSPFEKKYFQSGHGSLATAMRRRLNYCLYSSIPFNEL